VGVAEQGIQGDGVVSVCVCVGGGVTVGVRIAGCLVLAQTVCNRSCFEKKGEELFLLWCLCI
jgi:hypothetical protein